MNGKINVPCWQVENRHNECDGELANSSIGLCECSCHKKEDNAVSKVFKELDALCQDTGVGFGLDLEDSLSNHARDGEGFRKRYLAIKKKMGIK